MDPEVLIPFTIGLGLFVLAIIIKFLWPARKQSSTPDEQVRPVRQRAGGVNRRQGARNRAARQRIQDSESEPEVADEDVEENDLTSKFSDQKLGTKKKAKLEAKAEKRAQREAEERQREEKKAKQAAEDLERKKQEVKEAEDEKKKEEERKRSEEEKAKRDQEAYLALKSTFTVEGEGCDTIAPEEEVDLIQSFVTHIKEKKVVLFEELATQFGLKVPEAINRLETLVEEGRLTGVLDDRGKFIYISEEELNGFAKFIKQRGRVSITDLVENSSTLINLNPEPESSATAC